MRVSVRRVSVVLLLVVLAGCGDGVVGGAAGGTVNENEVRVGNFFFTPSSRTVAVGTTVTWTWNSGGTQHNVTFGDGPASGSKSSGSFQRTFAASGAYPYQCTLHPGAMTGTITVP